ncbi:hypothetical protein AMATHDRAFT_75380 [Amanita thiersii Skay4041]|uniref:Nucleoporin Nup133/Nup155-like N-terminal domain-containing protein n=1 Tax=Amanita thiersii Skay4041 TaxID=703135 RepID=A0A2A9NII4_9AGAR|nr:hypothetical protein AMATHDRAFT_75380 [Amanita thiersii Skay4041]
MASRQPAPVDLPALQAASRFLHEQFAKDAQSIPDYGDMLTARMSFPPSAPRRVHLTSPLLSAGVQVSASYSVFPDDIRVPYQKKRFIGIPDGLFQYYDSANVNSHMGLMPDIERVWISIDHKLFLWDYVDGQEINSFVEQPDVITHVALVNAKQGVFIDAITSVLVICTPVSVLLIGVSTSTVTSHNGRPRKEIQMYATDLSIQTDVEMTSVVGTKDGRIFMCGSQDGNLYELYYQESESWFGKRIQFINHSVGGVQSLLPRFASSSSEDRIVTVVSDTSRNFIYTLTIKNSISIYKPSGAKSMQHVQTISNIYKAAQDKAPGSSALTPQSFHITSLHVIEPQESRSGIQLLAVTTTGLRLYFSPSFSYGYSSGGDTGSRPLQLIHVRLPPTNLIHPDEQVHPIRPLLPNYPAVRTSASGSNRPYIVTSLESSCYISGLMIASQQGDAEGTDFVLCLSPDLTRIGSFGQPQSQASQQPVQQSSAYAYGSSTGQNRVPLVEYATLLAIPGRTWAMATVPRSHISVTPGTPAPVAINELALQFGESPQQFMLLTNVGLTFLVKRRSLDYLKAVLEEIQTEGNVQPIIDFRDSFGRDQTCAMLLSLAAGNTYLEFNDSDSSPGSAVSMVNPDLASVAKQAFYDFGERPIWTERVTYGKESQGSAIFSGRREGFALYFARLVRPIWKSKLTKQGPTGLQELAVSDDTLVTIQKNLYSLKDFMDKNPHLFHAVPGESASGRAQATEQEAWKAEQHSVAELLVLLTRTIEALSFILLLNDYRLGELILQCDAEVQKQLASQTYEELITTQDGLTVSRALVNIVIDQQIGQQISVDTISEVLQHRCGSFCSTDDVMLYKAKENIRKAVETRSPTDKQNWLAESLRLFIKGARVLEFEKLREVCGDYQQLNYAKGAILLPLTCARVLDPDNLGLEYWHTSSMMGQGAGLTSATADDPRSTFLRKRHHCYDLVKDSLTVFEEKCNAQSNTKPTGEDLEPIRNHAYELAFASDDEMFHSVLYDWLIERNLADDLLEMRPPYLEAHLKREPATVQKYQLLWQFYVKNGQPLRAAEVLGALAESNQFDLDLDARLECLTLAVTNAKSHPVSIAGRHETAINFLTDLEEKLDVAQVQLEIYNTLYPHINDAPEVGERIKLLTGRLFNMTELYQLYAVAFGLPEMQLLCLHVSEHRDESVVRPIWNRIFEEVLREDADTRTIADAIISRIVPLGKRFYPSESAFPLQFIAKLLVSFTLAHKNDLPFGWAPRTLVQCGVPFVEVWDVLHEMYESQIPPFNEQDNVQTISSDIAVVLSDWLEEAKRPQSSVRRGEFPVGRIDGAIDQYISELEPSRRETKEAYENVKRQLRRHW